ncbi:MAG TPA: hypothetical protein VHU18_08920 [Rhizomicrobium sp.]|nr:hypothetical protein [Rhizomicrobium sp.]
MAGAVCCAQQLLADPSTPQTPTEEVIVSVTGLYGDWKMVLPEWPGLAGPVTGDFCNFKKRGDGVSIVCADDFLQQVPDVTLDGSKLRMRWGGALNHTTYDAVWDGNGTFDGEIVQAQMGLVSHRIKAKMERLPEQSAAVAPQDSAAVVNNYFADLASKSMREKYYEDDVYASMKKAMAAPAFSHAGFSPRYFGRILDQKGDVRTFPDVFKVSNAEGAAQWCLVRVDAKGLADVHCRAIP